MSEQLTIPGMPAVDPRREAWREHTAERWQADDQEGYAECVESVRRGELNKSVLARKFARSRNTIAALIMREFSVEQLQQINGKRAAMVVGESMERMDTLIEDASVEELGAVALAAKQASDIAQVTSGGPTEIREERHVLTVEEFVHFVGPETGSEGGKMGAMGAGSERIEGGAARAAGPGLLMEADGHLVPAGGNQALDEALEMNMLGVSTPQMVAKDGSNGAEVGDLEAAGSGGLSRGGGGRPAPVPAESIISPVE